MLSGCLPISTTYDILQVTELTHQHLKFADCKAAWLSGATQTVRHQAWLQKREKHIPTAEHSRTALLAPANPKSASGNTAINAKTAQRRSCAKMVEGHKLEGQTQIAEPQR